MVCVGGFRCLCVCRRMEWVFVQLFMKSFFSVYTDGNHKKDRFGRLLCSPSPEFMLGEKSGRFTSCSEELIELTEPAPTPSLCIVYPSSETCTRNWNLLVEPGPTLSTLYTRRIQNLNLSKKDTFSRELNFEPHP